MKERKTLIRKRLEFVCEKVASLEGAINAVKEKQLREISPERYDSFTRTYSSRIGYLRQKQRDYEEALK